MENGGRPENLLKEIDRYRQELNTDYIDCLLIHCKIHADWDETHKRLIDAFAEVKEKGIICAHGVSCHSLAATKKAAQFNEVNVNLVRINPQGVEIDTQKEVVFDDSTADDEPFMMNQLSIIRKNGHGIIGMKIIGEGDLKNSEDRKKSIEFAMQPGLLDAVTIGFKSINEFDEAF